MGSARLGIINRACPPSAWEPVWLLISLVNSPRHHKYRHSQWLPRNQRWEHKYRVETKHGFQIQCYLFLLSSIANVSNKTRDTPKNLVNYQSRLQNTTIGYYPGVVVRFHGMVLRPMLFKYILFISVFVYIMNNNR